MMKISACDELVSFFRRSVEFVNKELRFVDFGFRNLERYSKIAPWEVVSVGVKVDSFWVIDEDDLKVNLLDSFFMYLLSINYWKSLVD
jgi:hypothetical protein